MWIAFLVASVLFSCKRVENDNKNKPSQSSEQISNEVLCAGKAKEECEKAEMCTSFFGRTVSSEEKIFLGCIKAETLCTTAISCFRNSVSDIRVIAGKGCDLKNDWVLVECSNEETNAYLRLEGRERSRQDSNLRPQD